MMSLILLIDIFVDDIDIFDDDIWCLCDFIVDDMIDADFHPWCYYSSDDEEIHHLEISRSGGGFGFSIRGGAEYSSPLCVLRIADGGAAEKDGRLRVR